MFSNKIIYYYFCSGIAICMFLIVIGVASVGLYADGNLSDAWPLIRKDAAVGLAFLIPPVIYRISCRGKKEKTETGAVLYLTVWMLIIFFYAAAVGLMFAGAIKPAIYMFAAAAIPLCFVLWNGIQTLVKATKENLRHFWQAVSFFSRKD